MTATIRFLPLGDTWQTLGADRYKGVVAQGIEATANEWGPDQLTFSLQTQAGASRPDLLPYTPVELEVDGILCWSGRVRAKPASEREITVSCEGWQYHLDDDLLERMYVHQTLADWRDIRDTGVADIGSVFQTGYRVNVSDGGILLALPPANVAGNGSFGCAYFDAGPDSTIARFSCTYLGGGGATLSFRYETSTNAGGGGDGFVDIDATPIATGSTTVSVTPANARRFLRLGITNTSGGNLTGATATHWCRVTAMIVYRSASYESGNVSVLKADTVVKDARNVATLLNQSDGLITAGTFSLPEYATNGLETPRAIIESVNAYEDYNVKIGGPDLKQLVYRVKPTAPLFEVGERAGASFADDSASGEDVFNEVIVEAQDNAGQPVRVSRTQTGDIVTRRGFTRSRTLEIRSAIASATANQLGDLWLAEHRTIPMSGTLTGQGAFVRSVTGGNTVPPAAMLLHSGELIRLAHRRDPDTGAQGRDGRIVGVSYRPETEELTIQVDNRPSSFSAALARHDFVQPGSGSGKEGKGSRRPGH